jgi:hypothetical protein
MDKALLADAVRQLDTLVGVGSAFALPQAVRQFNSLLTTAQAVYSSRPDIGALEIYERETSVNASEFTDAVRRFRAALELRTPGSLTELVDGIQLPSDAPADLSSDLQEFREAVGLGLRKTALLLAGAIAEALLLVRHQDSSERGPGLAQLVVEARDGRLFGRDTLRQLETLNDYRDLIHTRAGPRNRITANDARVEHAAMALKLLCAELEDISIRF